MGWTDGPTLRTRHDTYTFPISAVLCLSGPVCFAFDQGKELAEAPLKEKAVWIERLASESSERSIRILQLWLDGELVYWGEADKLVRGIKEGRQYRLENLVSGEQLTTVTSARYSVSRRIIRSERSLSRLWVLETQSG